MGCGVEEDVEVGEDKEKSSAFTSREVEERVTAFGAPNAADLESSVAGILGEVEAFWIDKSCGDKFRG